MELSGRHLSANRRQLLHKPLLSDEDSNVFMEELTQIRGKVKSGS